MTRELAMKPKLARPTLPLHRRRSRRSQQPRTRIENFFFGFALVAFGLVAWGWQQRADWAEALFDYWPMLLVWLGLGNLLSRHFAPAVGMVLGGALVQLHILGIADLEYTWPLILVAVGLAVTAGALFGGAASEDVATDDTANDPGTSEEQDHGAA